MVELARGQRRMTGGGGSGETRRKPWGAIRVVTISAFSPDLHLLSVLSPAWNEVCSFTS